MRNARPLFAADDFSRRHFQMHFFFLGALRVNRETTLYLICLDVNRETTLYLICLDVNRETTLYLICLDNIRKTTLYLICLGINREINNSLFDMLVY